MLKVQNLTKKFGGVRAVGNLDFNLEPKETLGLIGPNGSGKTTVTNLVTGLISPDSGMIKFKDKNINGLNPNQVCKLGVSRTFQLVRVFPHMSVLDNVMIGSMFGRNGNSISKAKEKSIEYIEFVGLKEQMCEPAGSLNYINQKRLELARALATEPEILFLDEFLAGLNPTELATGIKLVESVKGLGINLVIIEHIISAIIALCDKVVALNAGEKICEGAPMEVLEDKNLIDAYLGDSYAS